MSRYKLLAFLLVFILAVILRVWDFGHIPAGFYVDEASKGYDAYSLLLTGKDEYGKSWPVFFRSFGTYASSLYVYLTVVPVKILGLNVLAVRAASLISGLLLVIVITAWLGPIVGLVVAVSPIFVFVSRAAFEPNLALSLLILASVLALRARKNIRFLPVSYFIFSLSSYAYHAERFLTPLCVAFFSFYYWRVSSKLKKFIFLSCLLFVICQLPLWFVTFTPGAGARVSGLGYTGPISQQLFTFTRLYSAYFSPNNLFSKPDPDPQRSFPDLSVFYWWMIVPFVIGAYNIFSGRKNFSLTQKYLLFLGIISAIPGAITKDYFSTLRVLPLFIVFSWLIATGLFHLEKNKIPVYILVVIFALVDIYSGLVLLRHERSTAWNFEYQELSEYLNTQKTLPVVLDNSRLTPAYILVAFYNKYPPVLFQTNFSFSWLDDYYNHVDFAKGLSLGNLEFRPISWSDDVYVNQLIVADSLAISSSQQSEHHLQFLREFTDITGRPVLKVYRTDPAAKCAAVLGNHEKLNPSCSAFLPASIVL